MPLARLPEGEVARLRSLDVTYPRLDGVPPGYRSFAHRAVIGRGRAAFRAAAEAVQSWQVQLRSGLSVAASDRSVQVGSVALLRIPVGPLRLTAYCRVVEVIDEPSRVGFAYGTLPGHPESGEESFVVTIDGDDVVRLEVAAFSRPASWYARLGGPVTRWAQDAMTGRYLRALAAADPLPTAEITRLR